MTATITRMDYRLVDVLNADQLEVNDLIGLGGEVVRIISIDTTKDGFDLLIENEFSEKETIEISDDEQFELFVLDL
jgi:hypothetical protein